MFLEENYKIDKVGFPILNLMARKSERFLWNIEPGMKLYLLGENMDGQKGTLKNVLCKVKKIYLKKMRLYLDKPKIEKMV